MKVGIALIPCNQTIEAMIELQRQIISICPMVPRWGTKSNLPHITLLQGQFSTFHHWDDLLENLRDYWHQQGYSREFRLNSFKYKPPGWYFLQLDNEQVFFDLHHFVFSALENYIDKTVDLNKYISSYSNLEKINYLKYGYRYIGNAFDPHITLGKIVDRFSNQLVWGHLVESFAAQHIIKLQAITVYQMGDYGSHVVTLHHITI